MAVALIILRLQYCSTVTGTLFGAATETNMDLNLGLLEGPLVGPNLLDLSAPLPRSFESLVDLCTSMTIFWIFS